MTQTVVPFTETDVKDYLDKSIEFWRKSNEPFAECFVDMFQSVRMSLFGELLSPGAPDSVPLPGDPRRVRPL